MRACAPAAVVAGLVVAGLLTLSSAPARAQARPGASTIAVLPLRVENLQQNEVQRLTAQLRARASTRGGYDVQSEQLTTELLEASQSLGLDCDVNAVGCGTKIGKIADVDLILLGRAAGLEEGVGLDLRVIDVRQGAEVRRATALVPRDIEQQAEAITAYAEVLFGTSPLLTLAIEADPAEAEVFVDGVLQGVSPLTAPVGGLVPGRHVVVVQKKGFFPHRETVQVLTPAVTRATLIVDPDALVVAPGAGPSAAPWILTAAGGVVLAGGTVAAVAGGLPYARWEAGVRLVNGVDTSQGRALTDAELADLAHGHDEANLGARDWQSWGQATFVAGLVAAGVGALATAGGIVWGVSGGEPAGDEPAPAPTPSR